MRAEQLAGQAVTVAEWPGALTAAKGVTVVGVVKDGQ